MALLAAVVVWLLAAWGWFLLHDILGAVRMTGTPAWTHLFNNRPVEWTQWYLLAFAVAGSAYVGARLAGTSRVGAMRFFLLLSLGLGLMLVEEAGDVRPARSGMSSAKHRAGIRWELAGGDFLRGRYSREHTWTFDGGASVAASSSPDVVPVPHSNPACVDPEEAFVAAVASCHMLTFLGLAFREGSVRTEVRVRSGGV